MSGLIFDFTVKHKIYVRKYSIGLLDDINVNYDNCYFRKLIPCCVLSRAEKNIINKINFDINLRK